MCVVLAALSSPRLFLRQPAFDHFAWAICYLSGQLGANWRSRAISCSCKSVGCRSSYPACPWSGCQWLCWFFSEDQLRAHVSGNFQWEPCANQEKLASRSGRRCAHFRRLRRAFCPSTPSRWMSTPGASCYVHPRSWRISSLSSKCMYRSLARILLERLSWWYLWRSAFGMGPLTLKTSSNSVGTESSLADHTCKCSSCSRRKGKYLIASGETPRAWLSLRALQCCWVWGSQHWKLRYYSRSSTN